MATNNDLAQSLEAQSAKIDELVNTVNTLAGIAARQLEGSEAPEEGKGKDTPENAIIARIAEVAKTTTREALAEAKADRALYQKPSFQIAVGVAVVGATGYFVHKALKQSKAAHATSQRNSTTLALFGPEPDGDGGVILTGITGIGKK